MTKRQPFGNGPKLTAWLGLFILFSLGLGVAIKHSWMAELAGEAAEKAFEIITPLGLGFLAVGFLTPKWRVACATGLFYSNFALCVATWMFCFYTCLVKVGVLWTLGLSLLAGLGPILVLFVLEFLHSDWAEFLPLLGMLGVIASFALALRYLLRNTEIPDNF